MHQLTATITINNIFSFNVHGVIYVGEGDDGALVNMP